MTVRKRVGVLISGRGSNLASLIEAARAPGYPAEIVLVLSNKADASRTGPAPREAGDCNAGESRTKGFPSREDFDAAITRALKDALR